MQFEDFDKKIIDAAEHHHPAYEENAWEKMETLLDKHMPVKKDDRRRIIFFLFLFLLLGSGAFLLFRSGNQTKTQLTKQQAVDSKSVAGSSASSAPKISAAATNPPANENAVKDATASVSKKSNSENSVEKVTDVLLKNDAASSVAKNNDKIKTSNAGIKETTLVFNPTKTSKDISGKSKYDKGNYKKTIATNSLEKKKAGNTEANSIESESTQKTTTIDSKPVSDSDPVKEEISQKSETLEAVKPSDSSSLKKSDTLVSKAEEKNIATGKKKTAKNTGKQKQFPLAFTFSAGPDLSFISVSKLGKVNMRYGAGLSYSIKRFTVRSGFYVSKKVYTADGYSYHPFYPNLEKVDGDCKVFEIPVTVNYNFAQRKNYNWFVSTGLSSYLMKRETYDYFSKDPWTGTSSYYSKTWSDKNKHYFSVLNLSAGYERKFTKAVSLIAEPYLQIPLTGVGNGKMKLNSAGVLITLSVKPFSGKKK